MMSKPRLPVYDEEWLEAAYVLRSIADSIEETIQTGDSQTYLRDHLTENDKACVRAALSEAYRLGNIPKSN